MVPGKNVPRKMAPGKNGPRKIGPRKNGPRKNGPRKFGPRETQKQKIVGWASSIVVYVRNVGMWSIYENPKLDHKPKTRKQTRNTETKNRGVSVEHCGVCVCVCVWHFQMWSIYENPKLDNKSSWTPLVFYNLVHM